MATVKETQVKTCKDCGQVLPLSEYYANKKSGDGLFHSCKACHCRWTREYRAANDGVRVRDRERNKKRRAYRRAQYAKYLQNNRPAREAHRAVYNALKAGKLLKQPCSVCGSSDVQAHHEDYSKPLDVVWLCPLHHAQHHAQAKMKWTIGPNGTWVEVPAPPQDLPYFSRIATLSANQAKETTHERR